MGHHISGPTGRQLPQGSPQLQACLEPTGSTGPTPVPSTTVTLPVAGEDLSFVRQGLESSDCIEIQEQVWLPSGDFEIVVTVRCAEELAQEWVRFIIQTWQWRPDAGTPASRGEPLPREEAQQRKREQEFQLGGHQDSADLVA